MHTVLTALQIALLMLGAGPSEEEMDASFVAKGVWTASVQLPGEVSDVPTRRPAFDRSGVYPCEDLEHGWVVGSSETAGRGVYIVDVNGKLKDQILLNARILSFEPAPGRPCGAWVTTPGENGASQSQTLQYIELVDDKIVPSRPLQLPSQFVLNVGRARVAWLSETVTAHGSKRTSNRISRLEIGPAPQLELARAYSHEMEGDPYASADLHHAWIIQLHHQDSKDEDSPPDCTWKLFWLADDGVPRSISESSKCDEWAEGPSATASWDRSAYMFRDTSPGVLFADMSGNAKRLLMNVNKVADVTAIPGSHKFIVSPDSPSGDRAQVAEVSKGLWGVEGSKAYPFDASVQFEATAVSLDGKDVWALSAQGELYLFDPSGSRRRAPIDLGISAKRSQAAQQRIIEDPAGDGVWVAASKGLLWVGKEGQIKHLLQCAPQPIWGVWPVDPGLVFAFSETSDAYLVSKDWESTRCFTAFHGLRVGLSLTTNGARTWARTGSTLYSFGGGSRVRAELWVNGSRLETDAQKRIGIPAQPRGLASVIGQVQASIKSSGRLVAKDSTTSKADAPILQLEVARLDETGAIGPPERDGSVSARLADDGHGSIASREPIRIDHPVKSSSEKYGVRATYLDGLGTELVWEVRDLTFKPSPWTNTVATSGLAALVILLTSALLVRVVGKGLLQRWIGAAWVAASGSGTALLDLSTVIPIHLAWLAGFVALGLFGFAVCGLVMPGLFQVMAEVFPFNLAAMAALRVRRVRRALYAQHVDKLKEKLVGEKKSPPFEEYVRLPARSNRQAELLTTPADYAWGLLLGRPDTRFDNAPQDAHPEPGERHHILIQSAGGRGKSAILREVVLSSIEAWQRNPALPLPVWISGSDLGRLQADVSRSKVERYREAIREALKASGGTPMVERLLNAEIDGGAFFVAVDGVTESEWNAADFGLMLDAMSGTRLRVIATARPSPEFEHEFLARVGPKVRLEPLSMKGETTKRYVDDYIQAHMTQAEVNNVPAPKVPPQLAEDLQKQFGSEVDGSCLPVVIRFAIQDALEMKVDEAGVGKGWREGTRFDPSATAKLYTNIFHQLLRSSDGKKTWEMLREAGEFCQATFWKTGLRQIEYSLLEDKQRTLVNTLRDCGLLIVTEGEQKVPRRAKFFHDSMQSFLTAYGVCSAEAKKRPDCFLSEAVARKSLRREGEPEVFRMCEHILGSRFLRGRDERTAGAEPGQLEVELAHWVNSDSTYRKEDILNGLPEDLRKKLDDIALTASPGELLKRAVEVAGAQDEAAGSTRLRRQLFERVAESAWRPGAG